MLYAKINKETNQMIGLPQELPTKYVYGSGVIVDRFDQLPNNILYSFDWIPCNMQDNTDPMTFYVSTVPEYDSVKKEFNFGLVPRDIAPFIEDAKDKIDRAASAVCSKYLSTGIGQEMRYLEKGIQADNCMKKLDALEEINFQEYPMIYEEATSCGMDFYDKLHEIIDVKNLWSLLAAKVEAIRVGAKKECGNETTFKGIIEKRDAAIAELRGL